MFTYRQRLWLKLSGGALRKFLGTPRRDHWRAFVEHLKIHPGSVQVTGLDHKMPSLLPAQTGHAPRPFKLTIFMTPCCWEEYTVPIAQLGQALANRGMQVDYLGGNAGPCGFFGSAGKPWTFDHCRQRFETLDRVILKGIGRFKTLNELVTEETRAKADMWFAQNRAVPVKQLQYRGWLVWEFIKGSYGRLIERSVSFDPGEAAEHYERLAELARGFVINYETIDAYLAAQAPDAVMIYNGLYYQERTISELARQRGIRVVAHENSSFADRKIFDNTGYIGNYTAMAAQAWPTVRARVLDAAKQQRLADYMRAVYEGRNNTIGQAAPNPTLPEIRRQLGIAGEAPVALLLAQIPFDTVMIYDLQTFENSLAFIRRTIEIFAVRPDWTLVVRLHPREAEKWHDATFREIMQNPVPANVRLVRGREINTYSLMNLANLGITATSQAGLEMLYMRKPLIVAGEAFYAHKGFTWDVPSAELYPAMIDEALRQTAAGAGLTGEQIAHVESYLDYLIFEHQVEYDRVHQLFPPRAVDRIEALVRGHAKMRVNLQRDN